MKPSNPDPVSKNEADLAEYFLKSSLLTFVGHGRFQNEIMIVEPLMSRDRTSDQDGCQRSQPSIVSVYRECGVRVDKIVCRLVKYAPQDSLKDLAEIRIADQDSRNIGFARYLTKDRRIELYVDSLVRWMPWIVKKTYLFPYLVVAHAFGHELDHHVRRNDDINKADYERSADTNSLRYTLPSFGVFTPVMKGVVIFLKWRSRKRKKE